MGGAKPRWLRMTSPSLNGMKIAMAKSIAVVRRSPLQRKDRITRPEKMSRIPLTHMKGKAVGSWIGMPKAVEAPTGLSMKLMPITMIALGTKRVHQNSGEFFLNGEVFAPVVMFISLLLCTVTRAENWLNPNVRPRVPALAPAENHAGLAAWKRVSQGSDRIVLADLSQ